MKKNGALALLGRYRFGASGPWHEEWNLHRVSESASTGARAALRGRRGLPRPPLRSRPHGAARRARSSASRSPPAGPSASRYRVTS